MGPLDVQLPKENEIFARRSGLLMRSSFESLQEVAFELYEQFMLKITLQSGGLVSFKVASELSASVASSLLAPVYSQINPDIVGSDYRDLNVALHYGIRLASKAGNIGSDAVRHLVHSYPSHDFIIDSEEANDLFVNVDNPSEGLYDLLGLLGDFAYVEQERALVSSLTVGPDDDKEESDGAEAKSEEESVDETAAVDADRERNRQSNPESGRETGKGHAYGLPSQTSSGSPGEGLGRGEETASAAEPHEMKRIDTLPN